MYELFIFLISDITSCSTAVLRELLLYELERTSAFCAFFRSTHVHFVPTF